MGEAAPVVDLIKGQERFLRAARGETVDRAPVWLMRQAGRYLPEYQALRKQHDFVACCKTPELATEISLQPWRRFGMDGVVVFCDILMPLEAMGLDFSVPEGGPILRPALTSVDMVKALKDPDAGKDFPYLMTTLNHLRRELHGEAAVIGFAGGPWTVSTYLLTGGKAADRSETKNALLTNRPLREAFFAKLIPMLADYLTAQVEAGADLVQLFDTWAGELSADEFAEVALPPLQVLIDRVRSQTGGKVPIIVYCNKTSHLIDLLLESGADVLSLDWRIAITDVQQRAQGRVALQGNLDPSTLLTTPDEIRAATRQMVHACGTTGYIANLGHGVLKQTPVENVGAFVETVQSCHITESAK